MMSLHSSSTPLTLLQRLHGPLNQAAWERFVRLYTPLLFSWARKLGYGPEDAADRVQDVLTLLAEKLPAFTYDPNRRFRAWLWTVFLNRCRSQARGRPDAVVRADRLGLDQLAGNDELTAWVEDEYRRHLVRQALQVMRDEFPETTWRACWEFVARGRPAAEVARELGVSVDVVYKAKPRVLRRLRQELEGLLD